MLIKVGVLIEESFFLTDLIVFDNLSLC
ncbi:hypothetical protein SaSA201_1091 [Streptococcus agalactiae]|nr:hypothetical protein SaSA30_1092 [Streptococcus agalactiae]AUO82199.1 hypothetical protein SaSA33_1090 [Streptococcus agalactiae]AUO83854.1 hypothetical protein SaSA53_1086 [Streptococcus agalactiae]AUO85487.1 hypothetical protein SaSA73_1093 [Streptococcus agalactiae]AUO87114.1 hypothetical protein SaSA1_1094 [Streptococcus agalactiae]